MIEKYQDVRAPSRAGHEASTVPEKPASDHPERRGYTAQNPTPLNVQDLKPPKGDTAVQGPKAPSPGK